MTRAIANGARKTGAGTWDTVVGGMARGTKGVVDRVAPRRGSEPDEDDEEPLAGGESFALEF